MKERWNLINAYWKRTDAQKRASEAKKKGHKVKITSRKEKGEFKGKTLYRVWLWVSPKHFK